MRLPPRRMALPVVLAMLFVLKGGPVSAVQPPQDRSSGWPPAEALVRHPEEVTVPQDEPTQQSLRAGHAGLRTLKRQHPLWQATIDPRTGGIDRAIGNGIPLFDTSDPAEAAQRFVTDRGALFAPGLSANGVELRFNEPASRPLGNSGARMLSMDLFKDDLPVLGAGLRLGVRAGRVVLVSTRALAPPKISSDSKLSPDQALEAVSRYAAMPLTMHREGSLAFYPVPRSQGAVLVLRHHLVHVLSVLPEGAPAYEAYVAWVDAHDGEVLAFFPEARHVSSCQSDPAQAHGHVIGGVRPNRADDPEQMREMPFALVNVNGTLVTSDLNGRFPWPGGTVSSTLGGTFFEAHCDNCVLPNQPSLTGLPSGTVDFGSGGASGPAPVTGNGTSTIADRTAFHHLQLTRLFLSKWDNDFFDEIESFVNIASTCNAFSSSAMLGFFASGGNCRNTGEIRDVVSHELGHTWDRYDGNDITNGGMSEWKGDLLALTIGGDSCVGESFRITGGPTSQCSGVRDMDEAAPGRADLPLTPAVCPTCATLTIAANPCGGSVHCLGQISGQASVHLLGNLLAGADDITGVALPAGNPAFTSEQSRWLLERLLVAGGPPMQVLNPASGGVSVYDAMALIDDEDGNLANGTPHAAYYNPAFNHHGLAEAVLVPDAPNCAPLSDPIVTFSLEREAGTGLPSVHLDWTPVGGATTFDIYRNTRAGDTFLPLAQGVTAGPFVDAGVRPGGSYRYWVAAVRPTGCAAISPGANVVTVIPGDPDVRISTVTASEAFGGSDGDGLIEPGEQVSLQVTLREEQGIEPATGVSARLSGVDPFAPVVTPGPIGFGTIPAGGTAPGASAFRVRLSPTLACGARAHFKLAITGAQGCWQDSFDLTLSSSGSCAAFGSAFVEMVPGSVALTGGGGDADSIPDNCEPMTVTYQVRNAGTVASGPGQAAVSSPHPGLTFSPQPICPFATLGPGAVTGCQFTFSLGGAAPAAGIPFTITANSAGNAAPSAATTVITAEANPPVYGTQTFDFEGSLQGWTSLNFAVSNVRANGGLTSAHAGSVSQSNICGKLTSPPLRVVPAAPSTLSFFMYALIEPITDQWYDRANVHVIDLATNVHTLISPTLGQAYNAFGTPQGGLCHNSNESGWGGLLGGFGQVTFDLAPFAGRTIQIEINYGTDEGDNREGIYVDDLSITGVAPGTATPDGQSNTCLLPEVSAPLAAVPLDVIRSVSDLYDFSWQDLGAGFQYNLYAGSLTSFYSHGTSQLSCGEVGAGTSCAAGGCARSLTGATLPPGDIYFVVTASAFGAEGTSGFASGGAERDPLQNTCTP
ncbi:MAG: hypothetical protein ACREAA_00630 [Candidatus Polarisedimenticolia bacterium]